MLTRRAIPLALALLTGISGRTAAQRAPVPPPEEVARAVLRADSAGDWAAVLALAHPEALTRFRARQVFQLRMLGAQGWPGSDSASTDSTAEAHWRQVRSRQERFMLDSIFQVPDADSLARTSPDTVYARWVRGIRARTGADSTSGYRVVGAVKASRKAVDIPGRKCDDPSAPQRAMCPAKRSTRVRQMLDHIPEHDGVQ